jgi:hypothetical protein
MERRQWEKREFWAGRGRLERGFGLERGARPVQAAPRPAPWVQRGSKVEGAAMEVIVVEPLPQEVVVSSESAA